MKYQLEYDAIKAVYPKLVDNVNLEDEYFLGALLTAEVITTMQKTQIAKQKPEALLDGIIISSLQMGIVEVFYRFLNLISESSQGVHLNTIAEQIRKKAGKPSIAPSNKEDSSPVNLPPIQTGQSANAPTVNPATVKATNGPKISGNEKIVDDAYGAGGGSIEMLQLLKYMQCVCRIENSQKPDGATGFVGVLERDLSEEYFIVTSHSAIPNETTAYESTFLFNYLDESDHAKLNPLKGGPDFFDRSGQWLWTDKGLKYTVVKVVKERLQVKYSGTDIEMKIPGIPMNPCSNCTIKSNDILSIIHQEPIMKLSDGVCVDADPNKKAKLKYKMDTGKGSGGAPIFKEHTNNLFLIAIHVSAPDKSEENHAVLMSEVVKHLKTITSHGSC